MAGGILFSGPMSIDLSFAQQRTCGNGGILALFLLSL